MQLIAAVMLNNYLCHLRLDLHITVADVSCVITVLLLSLV